MRFADARPDTSSYHAVAKEECIVRPTPNMFKKKGFLMMKFVVAIVGGLAVLYLSAGAALADDGSCKTRAAEKKLAGAALTSFMKKCEADATVLCDAAAAEKNLSGAAKASFTKKCLADAVDASASTPVTSTDVTTCKTRAAEKKLAGAALTSFMKKCEADATTECDTAAAEKKLAGAAKASFTKKCVADAVGS